MTLDHSSFPHLVDAIFSSADRRALLSLRGTSRAFRDRADSLLFAHIAVHVADDVTTLRNPSSERCINLPCLPFPLLASGPQQRSLASKLAHTRTVDLHAPIPVDYTAWFQPFATVHRLTPLAGAGFLLPAHTYVKYVDMAEMDGRRGVMVADWLAELPEGVGRSVIHLSWTVGESEQVKAVGRLYLPRGVDIVILLEPVRGPRGTGEDKGPTDVITSLLRCARRVVSQAKLTVVGFEGLVPLDLEVEDAGEDATDLHLKDDLYKAIQSEFYRQLDERGLPRDRILLQTREQWKSTADWADLRIIEEGART